MIENLRESEHYAFEGTVRFSLFQCDFDVYIDKGVPLEYAEKCVLRLNTLKEETLDRICSASVCYCEAVREVVDEIDVPQGVSGKDILNYVQPRSICISEPPKHGNMGCHIELDCDWEVEHGMEWTIEDGEIQYVGAFNDVDPFSERLVRDYRFIEK